MIRKSISFPPNLHEMLKERAETSNRSFTKQVVWMLTKVIQKELLEKAKEQEDDEKQTL
jgi:hypothetical protein